MELPTIFKKEEGPKREYFWALVLSKAWVEAGIWTVEGEKTEVLAQGAGASWQEDKPETLVEAADSTLSAAATSFGQEAAEPTQVVFGLRAAWTEGGAIKPDKLDELRKLSQELELSPAGFVVLPEAIAHYLKVREGAPPTAILVGVLEDAIDLSLIQNGEVAGTFEVGRSMSLGADVAEGLARFNALSQYPARILLYNHRVADLEEARQNLLSTDWRAVGINFLHTPKVEILEENVALAAVSLAGGAEVAQAKSVELVKEKKTEIETEEELVKAKPAQELRQVPPEELGFLAGEDIALRQAQSKLAQPKPEVQKPEAVGKAPVPSPRLGFSQMTNRALAWLGSVFARLPKLPRLSLVEHFGRRGSFFLVGASLLLLLLILGAAYWNIPRAHVTIYVAPRILEKTVEMAVDPKTSVVNQERAIIPGRLIQESVSGERTRTTTGTRTVGERAKGAATIYRAGPAITLPAGTILTSPNALAFTLDSQVQVASGSAVKRGEAEGKVTAQDIGAQYNLAAATAFTVGNFSDADLGAENKTAFSGGSSREVAAVAPDDREALEKELTAELLGRGLETIRRQMKPEEVLIEETAAVLVDEQNFSHKAGEEATTLKLAISGKVQALLAAKDGLNALLLGILETDVPQGYTLPASQIKSEFEPSGEAKAGAQEFSLKVTANLLPQIDPEEVARQIAGKYPEVAREYLSRIPGYTRVAISFSIRLPGRLGTLPRVSRNITIEVASER